MRTLVVSDLHLGGRVGRDVLRAPIPRARLLAALEDVDRLVLLGDTVELLEARPRPAMAIAEPVLRDLGAVMAPGQIVLVPGNHDRLLIRDWLRRPGRHLGHDTIVPAPEHGPLLEQVVGWLRAAGAPVEVRYPGVWLGDRIWATHGHYLDRHLLPESAFGIARGLLGRLPADGAEPMAYEQRRSVTALEGPVSRLLPTWAAKLLDDVLAEVRRATMAGTRAAGRSDRRWLSPLRAHVLGVQMRRASIPALARVAHRLGVDARADSVIFGHVHRLGPRASDDPAQWTGPGGLLRIYNTGCWVHEPVLLHRARPPHPYWPGGAIVVDGDRIDVVNLLDDVPAEALRA